MQLTRLFRANKKKHFLIAGSIVGAVIIIVVLGATLAGTPTHRSESYKTTSGAAGLHAVITYDAPCDKRPCSQKPAFDFNVYIYNADGQQINVVRPDKDGNVNLALPEGNYAMLIGKRFGKDKLFPQEPLALKNGRTLELKLDYN